MSLQEFVIHPAQPVDPFAVLKELAQYPVALLSDNLFRTQGCKGLQSLGAPVHFAGTAVTVKTRPGDNLIIYKDGAVRDRAEFEAAGFPCHARGVNHRGPYKNGPGQVNVPVAIGGQVISPGDYVVGNQDGVLSFPPPDALALIEAARQSRAKEQRISTEIALGHVDQTWLKAVLGAKGLA